MIGHKTDELKINILQTRYVSETLHWCCWSTLTVCWTLACLINTACSAPVWLINTGMPNQHWHARSTLACPNNTGMPYQHWHTWSTPPAQHWCGWSTLTVWSTLPCLINTECLLNTSIPDQHCLLNTGVADQCCLLNTDMPDKNHLLNTGVADQQTEYYDI